MTTSTFSAPHTNATDAEFRAWGSGLSTALAAVGFVKTADTGQINWSTVLKPAAGSGKSGYEIWRFNDSLQATYPLFMKLEYGAGSVQSSPSLWVTVGKGSDGAGALTSPITYTPLQAYASNSSGATQTSYVASLDGSALCITLGPATGIGYALTLVVERSRNLTGTSTGDGFNVVRKYGSSWGQSGWGYLSGTEYVLSSNVLAVQPPYSGSMAGGTTTAPIFPLSCYAGGSVWQSKAFAVGHTNDIGTGGTILTLSSGGPFLNTGLTGANAGQETNFYGCIGYY